ncbi:MAG: BMP family ABC transporter substrate-binding protein [Limnohabitans sp.]|nr:BMP family ABC transporter substrate-binding protein [Limnohabitans sp.]
MYKNLIVALWAAICVCFSVYAQNSSPPFKVAFLYVAPLGDSGWVYQHNVGRLAIEKSLNKTGQPPRVITTYVENVAEGPDAERVLRDLVSQGYGLILTPSFGYMEPTIKVAAENPQVKFESITGYKRASNVATANARYYEGRYLTGVAAARMSQTGVAGYVAGFPIPEVIQGINAFTLGMRSINPKAQVKIIWLQTWFDPAREREAAMTLMNQDADVLAFHTGSSAVMAAAQERGKWAVAYHSDMRKVAPDAQILAVTHQWGSYYTQRVEAVMSGKWASTDTWGGVAQGMISVGDFGPRVPQAVRQEVLSLQQAIARGKIHPFAGPLVDNEGRIRLAKGKTASDAQILEMNYLVQGVVGK